MAKSKRYVVDVPTSWAPEQVIDIINQFALTEGFSPIHYKGEDVLKKGSGWATAPQFIKVVVQPGTVHIEAWLKNALLPGIYYGEMGVTGAFGFAIKQMLKDRVDRLAASVAGQPLTR